VAAAAHPLWTDYLAAWGAIVGVLVALVALVIAIWSAKGAARSAESARDTRDAASKIAQASQATLEAANGQLELARLAHERIEADHARRPIVERIMVTQIHPRAGEEAPAGTFRIGFTNTGDRELSDGIFTILLDPGSSPELTDRWGNATTGMPSDETIERWPGVDGPPRTFDYLVRTVKVPVGVSVLHYVRLRRHGRWALRVKLFSAELNDGGPWIDVVIKVDQDGVAQINEHSNSSRKASLQGRLSAFDEFDPTSPALT
jgi:hypothetical protein